MIRTSLAEVSNTSLEQRRKADISILQFFWSKYAFPVIFWRLHGLDQGNAYDLNSMLLWYDSIWVVKCFLAKGKA